MLNAIQKVKLAMGKKLPKLSMEYPKLNEGFEQLPENVHQQSPIFAHRWHLIPIG